MDQRGMQLLSLLASPVSVEICDILGKHGPMKSGLIAKESQYSQPTVSHALKVLSLAGILDKRREDRNAIYGLVNPEAVATIFEAAKRLTMEQILFSGQ